MIERVTSEFNDRLYRMLPAVYQLRDVEQGEPLRGLLSVISDQVDVVDEDLQRLYRNWFVETCDDWVVPYLAELTGFRSGGIDDNEVQLPEAVSRRRSRFLFPRRDVGNIISTRRRKGTLPVLEDMALNSANWPARAVEFADLTLSLPSTVTNTQAIDGGTVDFRNENALDLIHSPFETTSTPHLPSFEAFDPLDPTTRYGANKLGLFVWRHQIHRIERTKAKCVSNVQEKIDINGQAVQVGIRKFHVHPAAIEVPLHVLPQPESNEFGVAEEHHRPGPLRRLALSPTGQPASPLFYGPDRSLALWKSNGQGGYEFIDRKHVVAVDAGDAASNHNFAAQIHEGKTLVDPTRGLVFSAHAELLVSYCEAAAGPIGGGPYEHDDVFIPADAHVESLADGGGSLNEILKGHQDFDGSQDKHEGVPDGFAVYRMKPDVRHVVIEIADSGTYTIDHVALLVGTTAANAPTQTLHIRAAEGCRPLIEISGAACDGGVQFQLGSRARLVLEGLLVAGTGIGISSLPNCDPTGGYPRAEIVHSTFIPSCNCCRNQHRSSVRTNLPGGVVVVSSSILGGLTSEKLPEQVASGKLFRSTSLHIADSIIDGSKCDSISGDRSDGFDAEIRNTTVFGNTAVNTLLLAENSIFDGSVQARNPTVGGMRFCSVPDMEGRQTPQRYYCQPDLSTQQTAPSACSTATGEACGDDIVDRPLAAVSALKPRFVSPHYGHPGYGQLALDCPNQIAQGAEDESEMGAFHDLFVPQRRAHLQSRLEEFTPIGMESFIIFAN